MQAIVISGIVIVGGLCLIGVGIWLRGRRHPQRLIGFREWVRSPDLRVSMASMFADREKAVARLASLPPKTLVETLLCDDFDVPKRAIAAAGPKVVPALVDALTDPRFRKRTDPKQQEKAHFFHRRSEPLESVLMCLREYAPAAAAPLVAALISDSNPEIRKIAAMVIGAIGTDACVSPLSAACRDDDDYVRSYAMMGVLEAIKAGRPTDRFRRGAFEAILPLVYRRDRTVGGEAPRCLLGLDRQLASNILTSPENLVAGKEGLQYALSAMKEADVDVPEQHLLELAATLDPIADTYPNRYVLSEVLLLLARKDSAQARQTLQRASQSASKEIRAAATEALAFAQGLSDPYAHVWKLRERLGWDGITEVQRQLLAARTLIDQVNNGGFSQYFVNSSGSSWKHALSGLNACDCQSDLALLERALKEFGDNGPSVNDDRRHEQLAHIVRSKGDKVFSALESEFYKDREGREALLFRFILKHPPDFGASPKSP